VPPLATAALEKRLDALLNPVLSSRRTAAPLAAGVATLPRALQDFTLHWVEVIGRTNYEMAYQFAAAAPEALPALDTQAAEAWIIQAMDSYDREGLYQGSLVFKQYADFAQRGLNAHGVQFNEVATVLERFVCGLAGRRLNIDSAETAWTDTETLYLPPRITVGASRDENFLIYKIIATLLWAQGRYGTFNIDLNAALAHHSEPARALVWLNYLEVIRLEANIARLLPGLARDLAALRGESGESGESSDHDARYAPLRAVDAGVRDSIALLDTLDLQQAVPRRAWLGTLRPASAKAAREARLTREKDALQAALAQLFKEQIQNADGAEENQNFEVRVNHDDNLGADVELTLGGKPLAPPKPVRELLDSIVQDLGEIPDEYLLANTAQEATGEGDGDEQDIAPADGPAVYYDEWDFQRRHYRKNWCALRELEPPAGDAAFVESTLKKYAPQVTQLKRNFELLRGEDRLMKRQQHGDDIDLDAVIAAYADMRAGRELPQRLFTKRHKAERNLAVMFMVDMSGSTKGWINEAEREALVLLAEALQVLGDRYAIYGFSGMTRKRCEIFHIKRFDEPYSERVRQRIAGIAPQDYTRMGAAIRHLSALFETVDARTKLLITLSDGKPDDYSDNYRGEYGIEDTRQALIEAHRAGIKPFCITIDHEARDYLPHMYGAANWTLIDNVLRLPLKVADIYRRLTS